MSARICTRRVHAVFAKVSNKKPGKTMALRIQVGVKIRGPLGTETLSTRPLLREP